MSGNSVVKIYDASRLDVNRGEIMRYAACKGDDESVSRLIDECLKELKGKLNLGVVFRFFHVTVVGDEVDLTFTKVVSRSLARALEGCGSVAVFASTAGMYVDRLIEKYSRLSPAKALVMQAVGTERIETLCDAFCIDLQDEVAPDVTRTRFSPGYGDLPLAMQTDVFRVLDCGKIGLTLNDSLLMSPSKSVTAIVGISDGTDRNCAEHKSRSDGNTENGCSANKNTGSNTQQKSCTSCTSNDCAYRR